MPPFVYGTLRTSNGLPIPDATSIELRCGVQLALAIHPDLKGHFEFDLRGGPQGNQDMSAAVNPTGPQSIDPGGSLGGDLGSRSAGRQLDDCEIRISAPGFQPISKVVLLNTPEVGGVDVGTVTLASLSSGGGAAVSVNTLLVPAHARKEYEKAQSDIRHSKLPSATRHLQNAVAEYDKFAPAWNDLGRIYFTNHENDQAAQAYSKAIAVDPQFVPTYLNLAQLQYEDGRFEDSANTAGKALEVSPGLVPASYIQAVADLKLNRLDAAEKSARLAERGPHQDIPQVPLLLADILLAKRDYAGALAEMQSYLKDYPQGKFAPQVKSHLPEVQKLVADANADGNAAQPSTQTSPPAAAQPPASAPKQSESNPKSAPQPPLATLKLYLRMPDDSPFIGIASVRVKPAGRSVIENAATGTDGDATFADLPPGSYSIEAIAPGFLPIRQETQIAPGVATRSIYLHMTPELSSAAAALGTSLPAPSDDLANASPVSWIPRDLDSVAPPVEPGVACPLLEILNGASRHAQELV